MKVCKSEETENHSSTMEEEFVRRIRFVTEKSGRLHIWVVNEDEEEHICDPIS